MKIIYLLDKLVLLVHGEEFFKLVDSLREWSQREGSNQGSSPTMPSSPFFSRIIAAFQSFLQLQTHNKLQPPYTLNHLL